MYIGCSHHGDIRLESGDALLNSSGAVQVCYGNVWKSMCSAEIIDGQTKRRM